MRLPLLSIISPPSLETLFNPTKPSNGSRAEYENYYRRLIGNSDLASGDIDIEAKYLNGDARNL